MTQPNPPRSLIFLFWTSLVFDVLLIIVSLGGLVFAATVTGILLRQPGIINTPVGLCYRLVAGSVSLLISLHLTLQTCKRRRSQYFPLSASRGYGRICISFFLLIIWVTAILVSLFVGGTLPQYCEASGSRAVRIENFCGYCGSAIESVDCSEVTGDVFALTGNDIIWGLQGGDFILACTGCAIVFIVMLIPCCLVGVRRRVYSDGGQNLEGQENNRRSKASPPPYEIQSTAESLSRSINSTPVDRDAETGVLREKYSVSPHKDRSPSDRSTKEHAEILARADEHAVVGKASHK